MSKTFVGSIRPSQLLWTYGPGALIDLPNISVITMGLDHWNEGDCRVLPEERLLGMVRRILGTQVRSLRTAPIVGNDVDPLSPRARIGVPVKPFPRWLRCVKCGLLSPYDAGLFALKSNPYRPDQTRFVHKGCRGSRGDQRPRDVDAVPARFLLACRAGHLDDFPWHWFVHGGPSECKGTLRFFESGASLQTENLWVKCDECGAAKNMAQAFGKAGMDNLPACRGRHPHLGDSYEKCEEEARTILLGATNGWFSVTLSALSLPHGDAGLAQILADSWDLFEDIGSEEELKGALKSIVKRGILPGIERYEPSEVWRAIQEHRARPGDGEAEGGEVSERDLKEPEWAVLTAPQPPTDYPDFMARVVDVPEGFEPFLSRVLLLERLREVNALVGFTRVESPDEGEGPDERAPRAPLTAGPPSWVLASEVRGEGIFIQFDPTSLAHWEELKAVKDLDKRLREGHRGWRKRRGKDPESGYPGIRYVMLHTLAHLLIRELALECGYDAASIRERIYGDVQRGRNQGGILLYTAAADSDGTLGGLVELGKPENLGRLLRQALDRARVCSSDPLCAEHDPTTDQSLHGAACHACSFVSETSCERSNRYLERSLVVPTFQCPDAAFFS